MEKHSNKPLVSVIIPTYNRDWIVGEAIDSALAQDFSNYELIVVDDGSDDRTPQILAAYGDKITVLRQPNRGVSAARNRGVAAAAGSLIAFLDSDDLWLPHKLSAQVRFFADHPDAVINQTQERWVRNGVRVNPKKRHLKFSGMIFDRSLALCLVSPSAVMIKKSLLDTVGGFDEDLPACEDYDLWLRISRQYPVHLIDTPLIVKRGGHADQLSKAAGLDKYRIRSLVKLLESNLLSPRQQQTASATLKEKCDVYAAGCRKRGREEEANSYDRLADRFRQQETEVRRQRTDGPSSL
ncbi:MAG: glycosyltransferase [Desulfobacterales bacterium]|nr:glycosyltransferase [Desulfobacterales bacterium]